MRSDVTFIYKNSSHVWFVAVGIKSSYMLRHLDGLWEEVLEDLWSPGELANLPARHAQVRLGDAPERPVIFITMNEREYHLIE